MSLITACIAITRLSSRDRVPRVHVSMIIRIRSGELRSIIPAVKPCRSMAIDQLNRSSVNPYRDHRSINEGHLVQINSAAEHEYLDCLAHYMYGNSSKNKNVIIGESKTKVIDLLQLFANTSNPNRHPTQ